MNFPHGGTVDRHGNLWMTDARGGNGIGHQAIKFSPDGKVLMTLGTKRGQRLGPDPLRPAHRRRRGAPTATSSSPTATATARTTGSCTSPATATFVAEWGGKGSGPGQFSEPHTIAMDSRGRLFVGDRENNRIQIFDQQGVFQAEWRQFGRPSGIAITADDTIYVADSESGGRDTGAHELPGISKGIRIGSAQGRRGDRVHRGHGAAGRRARRRRRRRRRRRTATSTAAWSGARCSSAT